MTTTAEDSERQVYAGSRAALDRRWQRLHSLPWTTTALMVAVVLALVVRLLHLNSVGLNSDEAVYAGQAASIDNDPQMTPYFPVFRAHPLLFQTLLSVAFRLGVSDIAGRLLVVLLGVGTVVVTFFLARTLFGSRAGAVASLLLAVMPYHVVVSRQILLDVPMTLATTTTLLCLARYDRTREPRWILVASGAMALAVLTKETSIVLVGAVYIYLGLIAAPRKAWRAAGIGLLLILGMASLHPLLLAIVGQRSRGSSYLAWQLFRPPNHGFLFYLQTVPGAVGALVLVAAALSLLHRHWSSREVLLVSWIVVPTVFFTVWPVKGFQYLLPVAPALAVLAARGLVAGTQGTAWSNVAGLGRRLPRRVLQRFPSGRTTERASRWADAARLGVVAFVVLSLLVPTLGRVTGRSATALAGSGGIPGGRETGRWIADNVPEGARLITIGPSMANVIQFYGDRSCRALSVSTNPLHRNPVYEPIPNADLALRTFAFQYVVWDAYSAQRSRHFSEKAMDLVRKYNGRVAHVETLGDGSGTPVIVVYQVHP